jgi:hypothetical protein
MNKIAQYLLFGIFTSSASQRKLPKVSHQESGSKLPVPVYFDFIASGA